MLTLNLEREAKKRDRQTDPRVKKTLWNTPTSTLTAILKTSTLGMLWSLFLRGSGNCRNWPGQGCSSPQVAPAELNKDGLTRVRLPLSKVMVVSGSVT